MVQKNELYTDIFMMQKNIFLAVISFFSFQEFAQAQVLAVAQTVATAHVGCDLRLLKAKQISLLGTRQRQFTFFDKALREKSGFQLLRYELAFLKAVDPLVSLDKMGSQIVRDENGISLSADFRERLQTMFKNLNAIDQKNSENGILVSIKARVAYDTPIVTYHPIELANTEAARIFGDTFLASESAVLALQNAYLAEVLRNAETPNAQVEALEIVMSAMADELFVNIRLKDAVKAAVDNIRLGHIDDDGQGLFFIVPLVDQQRQIIAVPIIDPVMADEYYRLTPGIAQHFEEHTYSVLKGFLAKVEQKINYNDKAFTQLHVLIQKITRDSKLLSKQEVDELIRSVQQTHRLDLPK